ncbi:MAG: YhfC family intramembrane metalloprotease [Anaerolineaceae bacterium]|nr:YhfC family intramembrane metalloprotease [Anaerolineaceae bacterium]
MENTVNPLVLVPGIGMLVVSIAFIIYALRRGGTWGFMGLGALAWTVTVAIKFVIAISLNTPIYKAIYVPGSLWAPGSLLFYLYVGLLTGLTEVLLTWLLLRYTRLGRVTFNKALAFAIGFGAFEALLLGAASLASSVIALVSPQILGPAALQNLSVTKNILYDLGPIAERLGTILVHTVCNLLLFYGVISGKARWLWVSFAYKTLLDSLAGFAQMWGVGTIGKLWAIEGLILVFGILAWWGIRKIEAGYPAPVLAS